MNQQVEKFKNGVQHSKLISAVTNKELTYPKNKESSNTSNLTEVKFIPASGAATRMFKNLFVFLDVKENTEYIETFFDNLEEFAFYEELSSHLNFENIDKNRTKDRVIIIKTLLYKEMSYGNLPKALLKFHQYEDEFSTPIDEHIYESEQYNDTDNMKLHFTISPEHEAPFNLYVQKALKDKNHLHVSYSFQKEETNTMAVNMSDAPLEMENGEILYRPGGHGALIENLNDLDGEIIFIKNIDNVCHRSHLKKTIDSRKMLVSIGLDVKQQIKQHIEDLLGNVFNLNEIEKFVSDVLNITLKVELTKELALQLLNRPLRVCGVVKNQGEPGGGPFVVDSGDYHDLQICETSEIDMDNQEQVNILNESEYFNPVDLVCFVKDYKGNKFNLLNYINKDRYFISEKTYKGKPLKALEHPGLWNGAMHHWNTLFVEVPLETFNPVKTVNDLLKEGHRIKSIPL